MGIFRNFFKWFRAQNDKGEVINLGYVLDSHPKNYDEFEKVFKAFGLEKYFGQIKSYIRPKIDLVLQSSEEKEILLGESKIGGMPDLLNAENWPKTEEGKSMSFIGQLNCEDVSKYDGLKLFPRSGLISFFYCADQEVWGFDPKDNTRFKVIFLDNLQELKRIDFPKDLEEHSIFKPNKIKFDSYLSLSSEDDTITELINEDDRDNYDEATAGSDNQIFGYANCIQGSMELDCQLVTNGISCGDPSGYKQPKAKDLEKGKDDWILLLQIDSEEDKTGMMWGDSGRIYFWIKKQDLASKNFNNTWFILQCY